MGNLRLMESLLFKSEQQFCDSNRFGDKFLMNEIGSEIYE